MGKLMIFFRTILFAVFFTSFASVAYSAAEQEKLTITQVNASPVVLTAANTVANIRFTLNKPSRVVVKIYDADDALVWHSDAITLTAGTHAVDWPGKNAQGATVPPEAYFFTVEAQAITKETVKQKEKDIERVIYDLTDITGGENVQLENIRYNSQTQKLTFTASKTGRYLLRAGIARAFAINTLINNKVVPAGEHEITWDGYDASRVFNAAEHPKLIFGGTGYQLNSNAIVVLPQQALVSDYYQLSGWVAQENAVEWRESNKKVRDNIAPGYFRPASRSRDVPLQVTLPKSLKRNKDNAYIIQAPTPIKVDLSPADLMVMEVQRGEIVLFLDGQLIHDNEVAYYPYTFNWDPKIYDGKEHLLTVFVAGFAGNIGMSTLKVQLNPFREE